MATVTTYTLRSESRMTQMGERMTFHRDFARRREVQGTPDEIVTKMLAAVPGMTHEVRRQHQRGGGMSVTHELVQAVHPPVKGTYESHGVLTYDADELLHVVTA